MSIWSQIADLVRRTAGSAFMAVFEAVRTFFAGDAETRARVAFSIAIIALSAKMAKADGVVSAAEVRAFQEIFTVPDEEFENVAMVYNLAKQDVAGFDAYARQVGDLFSDEPVILNDVLDALFHIAAADGVVHEAEMEMLQAIAAIFAVADKDFKRLRSQYTEGGEHDPYTVLGASRDWTLQQLRAHYRTLVRDNHPDRLMSRGVPAEFMVLAQDRMAAINAAWDEIGAGSGHSLPSAQGAA
ncbi:MAG: molecular chaperone DjiA [Pseudomonadota bacterium]